MSMYNLRSRKEVNLDEGSEIEGALANNID
jgi:hypothetical protein